VLRQASLPDLWYRRRPTAEFAGLELTRQRTAKDNRKSAELILSQCLSDWRKKAAGVEFVVPKKLKQ